MGNTDLRRDIHYATRLIIMAVCFELDDLERLEQEASRSSRFFNRKGPEYQFEKVVTSHLEQIGTSSSTVKMAGWKKLIEALNQARFTGLLGRMELLNWAAQKLAQAT